MGFGSADLNAPAFGNKGPCHGRRERYCRMRGPGMDPGRLMLGSKDRGSDSAMRYRGTADKNKSKEKETVTFTQATYW